MTGGSFMMEEPPPAWYCEEAGASKSALPETPAEVKIVTVDV